jgi:hypothetical protein
MLSSFFLRISPIVKKLVFQSTLNAKRNNMQQQGKNKENKKARIWQKKRLTLVQYF